MRGELLGVEGVELFVPVDEDDLVAALELAARLGSDLEGEAGASGRIAKLVRRSETRPEPNISPAPSSQPGSPNVTA